MFDAGPLRSILRHHQIAPPPVYAPETLTVTIEPANDAIEKVIRLRLSRVYPYRGPGAWPRPKRELRYVLVDKETFATKTVLHFKKAT